MITFKYAGVVELVDSTDLGSVASGVRVRVPPPAPSPYGIMDTWFHGDFSFKDRKTNLVNVYFC